MKVYLRFVPTTTFGVVASPTCTDLLLDPSGKLALTAALENVAVLNLRSGEPLRTLRPPGPTLEDPETEVAHLGEVTALALSPDGRTVAVGYHAGVINLFEIKTGILKVTLHGHRSGGVACLVFSRGGTVLASGGRDTDIILWDLVAESGLYRLKGHKDGVTGLVFIEGGGEEGVPTHVVSVSKDALVKVWELTTEHCVQTLVGHRSEVWAIEISPDGKRMVTGAADRQLRVWNLEKKKEKEEEGKREGRDGEVDAEEEVCGYMGSVLRESNDRCLNVKYGGREGGRGEGMLLLAAQDAGKLVDIYKVRSEDEAKKKMKRRLKRAREKRQQQLLRRYGGREGEEEGNAWGMPVQQKKLMTGGMDREEVVEDGALVEQLAASDELEWILTVRASHKVRGMVFASSSPASSSRPFPSGETARLLLALANNSLEMYTVSVGREGGKEGGSAPVEYSRLLSLDGLGHRSDVRALALSSDDSMLASTCSHQLKVWSRPQRDAWSSSHGSGGGGGVRGSTPQCVRTTGLQGAFGLSVCFVPGDRHVVVGGKDGRILLIDLGTGDILETHRPPRSQADDDDDEEDEDEEGKEDVLYDGHAGAVWSMDVRPDGKGMATGGADKEVKFWDFDMDVLEEVANGERGGAGGTKSLRLVHTRTLKLSDDVLAIRYSYSRDPSKLLLAVALLDSTVKVFFDDSLKFFLSLYGHKLPVLSLDISDDNELIITGSADKTIKIWGLDFGDCHRSLLAHADSVMSLRFLPGTHCFFSGGKDKVVKYWDADHFELILTHKGHGGEVWSMAMGRDGGFFVSAGGDRSIRVWERSEDQVYLEEERQRELEGMFEEGAGKDGGDLEVEGEESGRASKRSLESVKHAERLGEALETAAADEAVGKEHAKLLLAAASNKRVSLPPPRPPNPLMLGLPPHRFILFHLRLIKGPDLEQALLVLPLDQMQRLLQALLLLLQENVEVELCWRCVLFLLQTHHHTLLHCRALVPALTQLRGGCKEQLRRWREGVAMNVEGLRLLKREVEEEKQAFVVPAVDSGGRESVTEEETKKMKKRKT
ncbi:wd repeat-containing protein 3 [Nannochloropsis oceanica]